MKTNAFKKFITAFILLILFVFLYGHFIGTKGLEIREYAIKNKKIPNNFEGFKIVHFTDLHYGSTIREKEMNKLVQKINEYKPDLVVFTGDLIEEGYIVTNNDQKILINSLNKINSKIGKYFVNGNHDTNKAYNEIMSKTDFTDLNNTNELIYYNDKTPIYLVGLNDYLKFTINIEEAFNSENNYYTILLAHEPDIYDKLTNYNIDLMLCGHSHNGQIRLPFIGALHTPEGSKKYYDEKYILNDTELYISGGLGTSTYPFRLLVKPSFNVYRFYSE